MRILKHGVRLARGWALEGFAANIVAPAFTPLIAYPKAWSPGANGPVRGEAVFLDVATAADLAKFRGKLKGKIVLFSPARPIDPLFAPPAQRQSDEALALLASATPSPIQPFHPTPEQHAAAELEDSKWQFLRDEGAAIVLQPSFRDAGTVYVTAATVPYPPNVPYEKRVESWDLSKPAVTPQLVIASEQYNRMLRLIQRGISVRLEVNISARFYEDDPMSYNVVGEIPGTDLKDEVVMLGGCIDSWHAGTGATDNAAGAATALEVMRILASMNPKPRRTIRIGLWSGEEQGRLGSRAYVAAHLRRGTPGYDKFDAYFNLDYGTGRIRGIYLQGDEAAKPIFRTLFAPFNNLGAATVSSASIGASDHISFDEIGLPGFQWIRDYMEGAATRAPHTNMDTYDHVSLNDLEQSAAVGTFIVYALAMRSDKIPRK